MESRAKMVDNIIQYYFVCADKSCFFVVCLRGFILWSKMGNGGDLWSQKFTGEIMAFFRIEGSGDKPGKGGGIMEELL
jgi:hypothetical protein